MAADNQETQTTLIGEPSGENVTVQTSGRMIRPLFELPIALVDECKLRFTDDGLHIEAVDPANVGMLQLDVNAAAFDEYDVEATGGIVVGTNLKKLRSNLRNARKGKSSDDAVELAFDQTMTTVEVTREYPRTELTRSSELLNIDPDSIRDEPDVPTLNLAWSAEADLLAFRDAVEHVASISDHIDVREREGDLVMGGIDDSDHIGQYGAVAEFDGVAEATDDDADTGAHSKFSLDYVEDFADALKKALVDDVTVRWDQEMPLFIEFERTVETEDGEQVAYEGKYMLAPRIMDGGA